MGDLEDFINFSKPKDPINLSIQRQADWSASRFPFC
mgnify:CR=1 FL=1